MRDDEAAGAACSLQPRGLAAGETIERILAAHPRLTEDGIRAALAFAADALRADVVYPASA